MWSERENPLLVTKVIARSLPEVSCSRPKFLRKKSSFMLGFSPLFIRQPTPYGISYFHFFLCARGYGKPIMCGSLGDFPKNVAVSCLVSDQIPFNLLSICSRMCLNHDLPTFYMQPWFLPSFPSWSWSPLLDGSKSHAK